jgi:hypothetical protein
LKGRKKFLRTLPRWNEMKAIRRRLYMEMKMNCSHHDT